MRSCHRAHRRAGPDLCAYRAPLLLPPPPCFLPIAPSSHGFPPSIVTEWCWHLSDREVVALGPSCLLGVALTPRFDPPGAKRHRNLYHALSDLRMMR